MPKQTHVRLPDELREEVDSYARETVRSLSEAITILVIAGLRANPSMRMRSQSIQIGDNIARELEMAATINDVSQDEIVKTALAVYLMRMRDDPEFAQQRKSLMEDS